MRPVRNVFQKLSRTEQRREGVVAYLWLLLINLLGGVSANEYSCAQSPNKLGRSNSIFNLCLNPAPGQADLIEQYFFLTWATAHSAQVNDLRICTRK
jgi:hypothetical protein